MISEILFKLPNGDYRFTSDFLLAPPGARIFIDPSTWCIHGAYEDYGRYIVSKSQLAARFVQLHPVTLGWFADPHVSTSVSENFKRIASETSTVNPSLTIICGDIVSGSGGYQGSPMEDKWFENAWNSMKNSLPNILWVKGNHDVDPGCYNYYNWFERLWVFTVGKFKIVGFDTFNEDRIVPDTCNPFVSISDLLWLRRRLEEDNTYKILVAHHPYDQWFMYSHLALREKDVKCLLAGHTHDALRITAYNLETLVNGCAAPEVKLPISGFLVCFKDGVVKPILSTGGTSVLKKDDRFEILAGRTISWSKEEKEDKIPVRIVEKFGDQYLNFIVLCPSKSKATLEVEFRNSLLRVSCSEDLYFIGRDISSKAEIYDAWTCFCGARWTCYFAPGGKDVEIKIPCRQ
ncbi:MAG: hypothetical protein DRJ51_06165 [Thermoprotei archaeon]|nr:MAG: hypothetical protein DRJ51_06165 [Thermoprotei archaeon]RLF01671.1 MAG: hypothetical protein DRJ59_05550 [Thermoprotei archaeon]